MDTKKRVPMEVWVAVGLGIGALLSAVLLLGRFSNTMQWNDMSDGMESGGMGERIDDRDDGSIPPIEDDTPNPAYEQRNVASLLGGKRLQVEWNSQATFVLQADTKTLLGTDVYTKLEEKSYHCKDTSEYADPDHCKIFLYRTGTVSAPAAVAGNAIYTAFIYEGEMGADYYPNTLMVDAKTKDVVYIGASETWNLSTIFDYYIEGAVTPKAPEILEYIDQTVLLRSTAALSVLDSTINDSATWFSDTAKNIGGITNVTQGTTVNIKDVLGKENLLKQYSEGALYLLNGKKYVFLLEDGSLFNYEIRPDEIVKKSWGTDDAPYALYRNKERTDGYMSSPEFYAAGTIGSVMCGKGYLVSTNIAADQAGFTESIDALTPYAYGTDGEPLLYVFPKEVARNMDAYKALYDYGFNGMIYHKTYNSSDNINFETMSENEKLDYFYSDITLVYWKDPAGVWRVFRNAQYESPAECGKPVVYLYPEQTQDVSVEITPKGGFTKTIPAPVGNTWKVQASPNSELYYYEDGQTYPYIFWESKSNEGVVPKEGFVMAKNDVPAKMDALLNNARLTDQEKKDFMEFWQPYLQASPYVFVTFVAQSEIDQVAPMRITPSPDYILRLFMYYEPLEKPMTVTPLPMQVSPRHGFSVIEWGGVLHDGYKGE